MLMLAVDLHEEVAQPLEEAHGGRGIVDEHAVTARAGEFALHDQLAVPGGMARLLQSGGERPRRGNVEDRLDRGGIRAGADEIGLGTTTPHEEKGVDDD